MGRRVVRGRAGRRGVRIAMFGVRATGPPCAGCVEQEGWMVGEKVVVVVGRKWALGRCGALRLAKPHRENGSQRRWTAGKRAQSGCTQSSALPDLPALHLHLHLRLHRCRRLMMLPDTVRVSLHRRHGQQALPSPSCWNAAFQHSQRRQAANHAASALRCGRRLTQPASGCRRASV